MSSKSDHYDSLFNIYKDQIIIKNKTTTKIYRSKASCKLSAVTGFVFGGVSSRFWLLRKSCNLASKQEFFSWQCLTIQTENRDIDLVIKNQEDMDNLLILLIFDLETLNGARGTARKLTENMMYE